MSSAASFGSLVSRDAVQRWIRGSPMVICGLLLVAASGAGIALVPWPFMPGWFLLTQVLVVVIPLASLAYWLLRCRATRVRGGRGWTGLAGVIFNAAVLIAVALPGLELAAGHTSKLEQVGAGYVDLAGDLTASYALVLLVLLTFTVGQVVGGRLGRRKALTTPTAKSGSSRRWILETRWTYLVLMTIGVAGQILLAGTPAADIANRGTVKGVGLPVLMTYGAWLAAALGILCHHWGSKALVAVTGVMIVYAESITVTRNALLIVGVACALRLLAAAAVASKRRMLGYLAASVVLVYMGAVLVVAISGWRAAITRHTGSDSFVQQIVNASGNPFSSLSGASTPDQPTGGLDTLSGLMLSLHVDRDAAGVSYADPLKAVTGFIPSQFWPSKPDWLPNIITHQYTNVGQGPGIFLSGFGYAFLVFNGALGAAAAFFLLGLVLEAVLSRGAASMLGICIWSYFLLTFVVEGDAINGLQLLAFSGLAVGSSILPRVAARFRAAPSRGPSGPVAIDRAL